MIGRGVGEYQILKEKTSKMKILEILSDGKPHRYEEIKQKTKLSSATLSKHLKELEKSLIVEKHINLDSGEYPYPVYYKLRDPLAIIIKQSSQIIPENSPIFALLKMPDAYLHVVNWLVIGQTLQAVTLLKGVQKFENINIEEAFQVFLDYDILPNLKKLFMKLLEVQDYEALLESFSNYCDVYHYLILPHLEQNAKGEAKEFLTKMASDYERLFIEKIQEVTEKLKTAH